MGKTFPEGLGLGVSCQDIGPFLPSALQSSISGRNHPV